MARRDDKIVDEAKERWEWVKEWEGPARNNYKDDIKFGEADDINGWQWPDNVKRDAGAPKLTINKTRQHNLQIVNDARQNKPQIRVQPVGDGASADASKVFEGIVRHIEYISDAQTAYDSATYFQVYGGIGYLRLITKYLPDSFDQEIYIRRVSDPLAIYLDPDIQNYDGSDANFAFIFQDYKRKRFDAKYPRWKSIGGQTVLGNSDDWCDREQVRVAEYFRRSNKPDTLIEVPQGLLPMMPQGGCIKKSALAPEMASQLLELGLRTREAEDPTIEWFKIAGDTIVERGIWPGQYIPLARVVGEETIIDGKLDRKGHTRSQRDPQRMYNYWSSSAVEHVALQGKTPWVGPIETYEAYKGFYDTANVTNMAYLPYKPHDDMGRELPRPERSQPPVMPQAYMQGLQIAANELMLTSGQYQAEMGAPSNERSGVAINARQRQADNATYQYPDHLAQAIRFLGRQLIDLIPKVYDTKRIIRILAEDGTDKHVQVDPDAQQAHQEVQTQPGQGSPDVAAIFNPGVGTYDVVADIGPAYATKRQEAFNAFSQIMQHNPQMMQLAGDIMFKAADFPMAEELAERLQRMVPPQALGEGQSPEVQQIQAQAQQQIQGAHQMVGHVVDQLAQAKRQIQQMQDDQRIKEYDSETRRLAAVNQIDPEVLKPVVRELVSQVLGTPIVPLMQTHATMDAIRSPDGGVGNMPPVPEPQPAQGAPN